MLARKSTLVFLLVSMFFQTVGAQQNQVWIRVNNLGYRPNDIKVAVMISTISVDGNFLLKDAITDRVVLKGVGKKFDPQKWAMKSAYRLDISSIKLEGSYYLESNGVKSPIVKIGKSVYAGAADYLLNYMRQQRCGDNPFTGEMCHIHDGFIVDHPTRSGEKIDVTGGWHDATDYLQYQTTSATALYQMMFAYKSAPDKSVFKDNYDSRGRKGSNGLPDLLDEINWGMEWLMKMNPQDKVMFSQIADDRDHAGYRLPNKDMVDYGWGAGTGRPVYFVTGKSQGLSKYKNRTTGVASVAGKFSSAFALGSEIYKDINPQMSQKLLEKSVQAIQFAEEVPGNTQTACVVSPYFYEEDSYVDDVELAAASLYQITKEAKWLKRADYWGELEPISPWMELGRGRHYQFYPFINLGHYLLSSSGDQKLEAKYKTLMERGLESIYKRGESDPFLNGIPYLWCSNNLLSGAITQAMLYRKVTGSTKFLEMESALRDWLFGCNPWGTSMIVGLPSYSDFPDSPHSSYLVLLGAEANTFGGLVDGPIERELFIERAADALNGVDQYAQFNSGAAVYHDVTGDYATNEPTMDGTASLIYYFSQLEPAAELTESAPHNLLNNTFTDKNGAIVRMDSTKREIYLIFSADSMFQGGEFILNTLEKKGAKASFFFTGNFLRNKEFKTITKEIIKKGHYVGAHSNKHLLYCDWSKRDSTLLSKDFIVKDLKDNYAELRRFGVSATQANWFLPPYEWYNREVANYIWELGINLINFTPGLITAADYTIPSMKNYKSTTKIIDQLKSYQASHGLNGAIILIHPGILEQRPDKLYNSLPEIIDWLVEKGYSFRKFE